MSIRYRAFMRLVKLLGVKKRFRQSAEDMAKFAQESRKSKVFNFPHKLMRDLKVEERKIRGQSCYIMQPKDAKPSHAVIYFFGGGFMVDPGKRDIQFIKKVIERTGACVMMPKYPLLAEADFSEICAMAADSYENLLNEFSPEKIQFIGFSSGASLCLNLFAYRQLIGKKLPWPAHMICSSPAWRVPPNKEEMERMRSIDARDAILSPYHIHAVGHFMKEENYPDLPSIDVFDFQHCCPLTVLYGTDEIFYAYKETVMEWAARNNVPVDLVIGENLCHCWQVLSFTPEGRTGQERLIKVLKSNMR